VGRYTPVGRFKSLISLATNAKNPPSVADHEAMHYIMDSRNGILTGGERTIILSKLQPGRPLFEKLLEKARRYDNENQTKLADEIQSNVENEAPAYAFEFWRRGELQVEGVLATVFAKIRNFLEKIVNFVNGQGFTSIEDIFAAIDRGQFAERQRAHGQFTETAGDFPGVLASGMGRAIQTDTPEFKAWFGDSKVVAAQSKPLVVYHGTPVRLHDDGGMSLGDFSVFDRQAAAKYLGNKNVDLGMDRVGNWFTDTPGEDGASMYAGGSKGAVYPVFLSIRNPWMVTFDEFLKRGQQLSKWKPKSKSGPYTVRTPEGRWIAAPLRAWLKEQGYDGIQFTGKVDTAGQKVWLALEPEQIKSAIGNTGAFDPSNPDITKSVAGRQEWYRSALTDQVGLLNTKQASAQGWRDQIKGLVAKGLVKQAEIDAVGLDEFLTLQQGRVTKDQVMSFLRENGVRVEETTLGERDQAAEWEPFKGGLRRKIGNRWTHLWPQADGTVIGQGPSGYNQTFASLGIAKQSYDLSEASAASSPTKFAQYQLPGGQNYRELVLSLPEDQNKAAAARSQRVKELIAVRDEQQAQVERSTGRLSDQVGLQTQLRNTEMQIDLVMRESHDRTAFRSTHFDQPNIIAHIRFNKRTDAEGKRVLFIEEIQADWAQKGKKEGFGVKDAWQVFSRREGVIPKTYDTEAEAAEVAADLTRINGFPYEALSVPARAGIPSAPFVTKTEAWVALSLKRMIRYAAENGFEKIAWTNGEQQVERYRDALRKQVDRIEWTKTSAGVHLVGYKGRDFDHAIDGNIRDDANRALRRNGNFGYHTRGQALAFIRENADWEEKLPSIEGNAADLGMLRIYRQAVMAINKKGSKVVDTTESESALSDSIGKAMADKIKNDSAQSGVIEGDGITISDTGMAGFYDRIVPSVANEVLRKLGGGRVGTVDVKAAPRYSVGKLYGEKNKGYFVRGENPNDIAADHWFNTQEEAQAKADELNKSEGQPGFTITPALVERAMAGLPLFSKAALAGDIPPALYQKAAESINRRKRGGELEREQFFDDIAL
ncbi:MAG: hypothetical protein Q7T82_06815, partial [Armatimonadota bacterium]|nr:hypothetical protein [Armatimonadota bacterium]